jgi:hypothetical protein
MSTPAESPIVSAETSDTSPPTLTLGLGSPLPRPKKKNNGWARQQEELMADWADIAACYRWLHDRTNKRYARYNMSLTMPVILLSTLTGTANFGLGSLFGNDEPAQRKATLVIGGASLLAGILATVNNYLKFAQESEANRVASISWGKFQRLLAIELAISPEERMDAQDFLKMCRNELDRLIEQSPSIPDKIIEDFSHKFGRIKNLRKPDICDQIEHTHIYIDKDGKLKHIAAEAALILKSKKRLLREMIEEDLEGKVIKRMEERMAIQERLNRSPTTPKEVEIVNIEDEYTESA